MLMIHLVILAIVQGITEFLPISSSAHLILVPQILPGWDDQGRAIDVAAHVGSLGAVMLYFRPETRRLIRGGLDSVAFRDTEDRQFVLMLAVATLPLLVFGLILALSGLADQLRNPVVIAWASIIFGIILWAADKRPVKLSGLPSAWRHFLMIGAAQALALIPGTSRSGITITAARELGYSREDAARFSMILAIPAILVSGGYETMRLLSEGNSPNWWPFIMVGLFSFGAAWAAIHIFLKLTRRMSFTPFVIYRVVLGIALLLAFS